MDPWTAWLWPWFGAMEASLRALEPSAGEDAPRAPAWTTPNRLLLDLGALRLRDFSIDSAMGPSALIVAPYALHDAGLADLAPGYSLIEALRLHGCGRLHLVEWASATPEMRFNDVDTQLSALNAAIDDLGPPLDLVGLCQGGWLSLVLAARFPKKVRKLVLAGAPVDTSSAGAFTPTDAFVDELIRLGEGRVLGRHTAMLWPHDLDDTRRMAQALQLASGAVTQAEVFAAAAYVAWEKRTLNLPGVYFREVCEWLYRDNRLAAGAFPALGREVGLRQLECPLYLLAGAQDVTVPAAQVFAAATLALGGASQVTTALAEGGHCALFMGSRTLRDDWSKIAAWLQG